MGARRANPKLGALTLGQDIGRAGLLLNSKPLHHCTGMEKRAMVHRCTGMVKRAMIHTADDAMAMRNKLLTYVRTISRPYIPVYACVHAYTYTWNSTYACVNVRVHIHGRVTFRPESKSDLGSCETILRDRLKRDKSSLARA